MYWPDVIVEHGVSTYEWISRVFREKRRQSPCWCIASSDVNPIVVLSLNSRMTIPEYEAPPCVASKKDKSTTARGPPAAPLSHFRVAYQSRICALKLLSHFAAGRQYIVNDIMMALSLATTSILEPLKGSLAFILGG